MAAPKQGIYASVSGRHVSLRPLTPSNVTRILPLVTRYGSVTEPALAYDHGASAFWIDFADEEQAQQAFETLLEHAERDPSPPVMPESKPWSSFDRPFLPSSVTWAAVDEAYRRMGDPHGRPY